MAGLKSDLEVLSGADYNAVDPDDYLKKFHGTGKDISIRKFALHQLNKVLDMDPQDNLSVLEIGAGPVIVHTISVAKYASEIVLSEYSATFRSALQKWVNDDPTAHNWTPYFKYIVEVIEGRSESEAKERETKLRKAIKAVVPCDITKDPPLPTEYMCQYDLVIGILFLEAACHTRDEYRAAVCRLYSLVRPGGWAAIYCVARDNFPEPAHYNVNGENFHNLRVDRKFIKEAFEGARFGSVTIKQKFVEEQYLSPDQIGCQFVFVSAKK